MPKRGRRRGRGPILLAWLAAALSLGGCAGTGAEDPALLIRNVTLLDGRGGDPVEDASVVVRGGTIEGVGRGRSVRPRGAKVIDGKGGFLLPGFIDVHAHLLVPHCEPGRGFDHATSEHMLSALLDFGITSVRSPATPTAEGMALRDRLNRGEVRGPRAVASAEFLNDSRLTPEQVRAYVREALAHRPDFFKAYARLGPEQVRAMVEEAHRHAIPVIGHLQQTSWAQGLRLGIDQLTHAVDWSADSLRPERRALYLAAVRERGPIRARIDWLELLDPDSPEMAELARELARRQVPVDPTLVAYDTKFSHPQDGRYRRNPWVDVVPALHAMWRECGGGLTADWTAEDYSRWRAAYPKLQAWVRRMADAGVPLATGSDLTNSWVIPGESLHQEFELLAEAGLSPRRILRMTGEHAARTLRRSDVGVVEPGRKADLVLLRSNPLEAIGNTRSIAWVMKDGAVVSEGPPPRSKR